MYMEYVFSCARPSLIAYYDDQDVRSSSTLLIRLFGRKTVPNVTNIPISRAPKHDSHRSMVLPVTPHFTNAP